MALNKYDKNSDAVADLYRASFYLAKESKEVGVSFLLKAKKRLGAKMTLKINQIKKDKLGNSTFWAEKVLDEYKRLKMNL